MRLISAWRLEISNVINIKTRLDQSIQLKKIGNHCNKSRPVDRLLGFNKRTNIFGLNGQNPVFIGSI